ncbi:3116_t:CDS:2 [Funneliformis geosporum]|nr:3116_t:CDS:2 [Funneliformis geosporum]
MNQLSKNLSYKILSKSLLSKTIEETLNYIYKSQKKTNSYQKKIKRGIVATQVLEKGSPLLNVMGKVAGTINSLYEVSGLDSLETVAHLADYSKKRQLTTRGKQLNELLSQLDVKLEGLAKFFRHIENIKQQEMELDDLELELEKEQEKRDSKIGKEITQPTFSNHDSKLLRYAKKGRRLFQTVDRGINDFTEEITTIKELVKEIEKQLGYSLYKKGLINSYVKKAGKLTNKFVINKLEREGEYKELNNNLSYFKVKEEVPVLEEEIMVAEEKQAQQVQEQGKEKNYNQETTKIDISVQLEKKLETKGLFNELKEIEGGKLDLSAYSRLGQLRINSSNLKSSLTELILSNNPELRLLLIAQSPELVNLDLSGCSQLTSQKVKINKYDDLFTASLSIEIRLPNEQISESAMINKEVEAKVVEVPPKSSS